MSVLFVILCPLIFGLGSALFCAWELPRRQTEKAPAGEEMTPEEARPAGEGDCVEWRGLRLDRRGLLLAGGLCLVGVALYLVGLLVYHCTVEYSLKLLFCFDFLAVAAVVDARCRIIPNKLILAGCGGGAGFLAAECMMGYTPLPLLLEALLGLAVGGGVFLFCSLLTRGGIGMGDVKLFGTLGLLLGWAGVFNVIFLSVLLVAVYGIVLLLRHRLDRHSQVPVGPFALAGMAVIMLLGV